MAFRGGNRAALSTVYRLYVAEVVRALRRGTIVRIDGHPVRLGAGLPQGDLEVLIQNTFIRAFSPSARAAYDGLRPYGPYLITIARNLLIDEARARNRDKKVDLVDDIDSVAGAFVLPDPTAQLQGEQLKAALNEVKRGLTPVEQELFRLRYDEEMSQQQAAQHLGISVISVRRKDVLLRERLLEGLRRAGHLGDVPVGIPSSARDRTRG
jgi:RNA polymerase sigma-70 factor (ECF subfamily)